MGFQVAINSRNSYLATPRGEKMPIKVHPYRDPGEWEHGTLKYLSFLEVIIYPLRMNHHLTFGDQGFLRGRP